MDADIVREVEFSRTLRGYNMAEVDAFLEKMEGMFRRRDLEQENAEKRLQQEIQKGSVQERQLALLRAELEDLRQQGQNTESELNRVRENLHREEAYAARLQAELEQTRSALAAAQADAVQADQRCKVLEESLEKSAERMPEKAPGAQPQSRLAEVSAAAKDSLKKLSGSLRAMRK